MRVLEERTQIKITNKMSQKSILISVAPGFLGTHLYDRFIKEG